ncbi:FAD-dependent oxidoreductase [Aspergillus novofumigatus IBT 16806]|uniref:FAD/NAD(P)-binding domain-containing protein n=1 Tax=Aspergillus novofumigatus (strain IBT 16806) TaxID=1392255 RepID=A0A2I1C118_ASPN1|nr:FAD/NAD(P)-binding domain-containing protein [Aspergillus novofumigatus IBT 16806]PKX91336.1 FAD/NAD(P)-binding domain-containing protein [Aspergillus novofumigatus IBT 16806]
MTKSHAPRQSYSSRETVIVVGGSIAGLTLAHCLDRAGIDHIVLEKAKDIAPQLGTSIGISPNGARILDQLGVYEEIEKCIEPLNVATVSYPDGFHFSSRYPEIIGQRFGFPIAFLDRQKLLQILYNRYPKKHNICLNKKVVSIQTLGDDLGVTTEDGSIYTGQLVVGADGVHSRVRSEMWKAGEKQSTGLVSERERTGMTVEYSCIFGISSPIKGLEMGDQVNAFFDRLTIITIHGKDSRIFWFVIQKLDEKYTYPNSPRFTDADAAAMAEKLKDVRFYRDITFGQVWTNKEVASMTALEETIFQTWHHGRMALMGANCAIEDAATLATLLNNLVDVANAKLPSNAEIETLLQRYRKIRYSRVKSIYKTSRFLVRLQARDGFLKAMFGRYFVPYAGDLPAELGSKAIADGEVVGFLPLPSRSGPGWVDYSSKGRGWAQTLQFALAIILLALVLQWTGNMTPSLFLWSD